MIVNESVYGNDRKILRELAKQVSEIAGLPIQEEKRALWRGLNGLKPQRPMVMIDQVCWHEMNVEHKLDLLCETPECRNYELMLRRILFQWEYFRVDMVVEPFIRVPKAIYNSGFGVSVQEHTLATFESNDVLSHEYENQFQTMDDINKIKTPVITHDQKETDRRMELANWLFGDIMALRSEGMDPYLSLWDPIATWMGVENALYAIIDEPELIHGILAKMVSGYMAMLDDLEAKGLLCYGQSLIHCTGAYCDELPAPGFDVNRPRTQDIWMFGLAQMFSTVSPGMFDAFEIEYAMPLFKRFGLVYYGCCDPLDGKMNEVKKIPNVRKISMSPWANQERGAMEMGKGYVFSRKPNPAFLAMSSFDEGLVRRDLELTKKICEDNGCPVEFILKDISTVANDPKRLFQWANIAMEVVNQ